MKNTELKSLQDILSSEPESLFQRLAHQQSRNDTLLHRIRALLPSHFGQHLIAVSLREEVLVLVADEPGWANRMRYQTETLRKHLSVESKNNGIEYPALLIQKVVTRTAARSI